MTLRKTAGHEEIVALRLTAPPIAHRNRYRPVDHDQTVGICGDYRFDLSAIDSKPRRRIRVGEYQWSFPLAHARNIQREIGLQWNMREIAAEQFLPINGYV